MLTHFVFLVLMYAATLYQEKVTMVLLFYQNLGQL